MFPINRLKWDPYALSCWYCSSTIVGGYYVELPPKSDMAEYVQHIRACTICRDRLEMDTTGWLRVGTITDGDFHYG